MMQSKRSLVRTLRREDSSCPVERAIQPATPAFLPALAMAMLVFGGLAWAQSGDFAPVVAKPVSRSIDLPGEIAPFLSVSLHAKVAGYVERMLVDRGSVVNQGDLLAELSAPEMAGQIGEAQLKVQVADADRFQAEAQLAGAQSTYDHLKIAAETPGAIAGNELILAEKQVDAAKALLDSRKQAIQVAEARVRTLRDMETYLKITAPFAGVVTDRLVHPGALVGPGADPVLLVLQQVSRLRLIVAVPEEDTGGIIIGSKVSFSVPAQPERTYSGTVARLAQALDPRTRTMAVELDVANPDGTLASGMYPTVKWPVRRARPALYVPRTSVVTTTERTFVVRNQNGRAQWVDIRKGAAEGDLVEVFGDLKAGDVVVRRATDELREGTPLKASGK
jgi:membrane fusion protein (multidrug efflux system)